METNAENIIAIQNEAENTVDSRKESVVNIDFKMVAFSLAGKDYAIDIMVGTGTSMRSIRIDIPKFTLGGATTRSGQLTAPLRDRFGVIHRLEFYTVEELTTIIMHSAKILNVEIELNGARELARRSRGTPRLANRILKRVRDFAQVKYDGYITKEEAENAKMQLEDTLNQRDNDTRLLIAQMQLVSKDDNEANAQQELVFC